MSFDKISRLLAIVLGGIGLVFTLLIFFGGESSLESNVTASIWISIGMCLAQCGEWSSTLHHFEVRQSDLGPWPQS